MKKLLATVASTVMVAIAAAIPSAHATTHAGDSITLRDGSPAVRGCTLTDIRKDSNGKPWAVTAAHCFEGTTIREVKASDGQVLAGEAELAQRKTWFNPANTILPTASISDMTVFPLKPGVDVNYEVIYSKPTHRPVLALLANGNPIADLWNAPWELGEPMPVTPALAGQLACKEGGSTGRTCGVIVHADPATNTVVAIIPSIEGDSGGSLHVMGADGKRHVVGTLSGGTILLLNGFSNPSGYPLF